MKHVKIALSGAHSTGKTTLLDSVKSRIGHSQFGSVSDIAAQCPYPILREHTLKSSLWIAKKTIELEAVEQEKFNIVIVDRPVIDAWGYYAAAIRLRDDEEYKKIYNKNNELYKVISEWLPTYTYIYQTVINTDIPIENNKGRDLDEGYRRLVGEECAKAIDFFQISCKRVTYGEAKSIENEIIRLANGE